MRCITERKEWNEILKFFETFDCYHTYDFNYFSKQENEEPVLLYYQKEQIHIALPLLIREIPNSEYKDVTSVWGYGGPLCANLGSDFDQNLFVEELNAFFKENKIISAFARLNPFIDNQEIVLDNMGIIEEIGEVVNIDLTKDIDTQRTHYSKTTKRYINKYGKLCTVKTSKEEQDILQFIDLYYENMDRVNAKEHYYFNKEYFYNLIQSEEFETDVLFATYDETNEIISAAMMIKTNNIIQYHMSGTRNEYLKFTPIRLLIDQMRIKGTGEGYKYFNLGGGLGGRDNPLLQFKASFSKDFKKFKVWKYIVDQTIYNMLCKEKELLNKEEEIDFFPLYRYQG